MTDEYAAAIAIHNAALAKFKAVRDAYRAKEVGDAEFLAAKKAYDQATIAYDHAFTKASS